MTLSGASDWILVVGQWPVLDPWLKQPRSLKGTPSVVTPRFKLWGLTRRRCRTETQQCSTAQQRNSTALHSNATAQHRTATQQYSNATAQQRNSTAPYSTAPYSTARCCYSKRVPDSDNTTVQHSTTTQQHTALHPPCGPPFLLTLGAQPVGSNRFGFGHQIAR